MTTFRLIHVTDTHFGKIPNTSIARNVAKQLAGSRHASWFATHDQVISEALIANIRQLIIDNPEKYYDAILVSGDLATSAESHDLDAAQHHIERLNLPLPEGPQQPAFFVLPGNHDGSVWP